MTTHELKADPTPFAAVLADTKRCEIRINDRDFSVGDILHLREFDRHTQTYTGRKCRRVVTHIQTGYGLPDGVVAMSIRMPVTSPPPDPVATALAHRITRTKPVTQSEIDAWLTDDEAEAAAELEELFA